MIQQGQCSKPFTWKNRKCVIASVVSSTLAVYDLITQEFVDTFRLCSLPPGIRSRYIEKINETDLLILIGCSQVLLLSFGSSVATSICPCNVDAYNVRSTCFTFSSDNLYFVCGYENGVLKILSVDNGETLQTIDLKHRPLACYWSKLYLWVACENGVIKLRKASSTHTTILENTLETALAEYPAKIDPFPKFAEGVLVFQSLTNSEIFVSKIFDEEMQQFQKISNGGHIRCSVSISSDGCAFLLQREASEFELWEIDCENSWQLVSRRVFEINLMYCLFQFCLTGAKNSRVMVMLRSSQIFFLNFLGNTRSPQKYELPLTLEFDALSLDVIYVAPKFLIIREKSCIFFIDILNGKTIFSLVVDSNRFHKFSYIALRGAHLFVVDRGDITHITIHNV